MKRFLLGLLFLLCAASAQAQTYYVAQTGGSDSNNCTAAQSIATPKQTIASGIGCMNSAGDVLLIRAGTYDETINNFSGVPSGNNWSDAPRIANYNGETVWLSPSSGGSAIEFVSFQHHIIIDGINVDASALMNAAFHTERYMGTDPHHIKVMNAEIIGPPINGGFGMINVDADMGDPGTGGFWYVNLTVHGGGENAFNHGFYLQAKDTIVENCDIYDWPGAGIQVENNFGNPPTGDIIRNNKIHDLRVVGDADRRHWGMVIAGGAVGTLIYNNLIYGIPDESATSVGIDIFQAVGALVYNNTIYNDSGVSIGISLDACGFCFANDTLVKNNISYGHSNNYVDGGTGTIASGNLFGTNPDFTNPGSFDFSLQGTSDAIDIGDTLAEVPTDILGNTRPFNLIFDAGAYEYGASGGSGGNTYYLSTSGSSSNDCTAAQNIATPKQTMGDLITNCGPTGDDLVLFRAGTYSERLNNPSIAGSSGHLLKFAAYPGNCAVNSCETVLLRPTGSGPVIAFSGSQNYIEFDGIKLSATSTSTGKVVTITAWASGDPHHLRFLNGECTIGANGIANEADFGEWCFDLEDERSGGATGQTLFQNWNIHGGGDSGDTTFCFKIASKHITLRDIDCHGTRGAGIQIYQGGAGGDPAFVLMDRVKVHDLSNVVGTQTIGILAHGSDHECWNCLIYNLNDSDNDGRGIDIYQSNFRMHIYNSNFYNINGRPIHAWSFSGNAVITNNILFGNFNDAIQDESTGGIGTLTTNLIGANPSWVSPSTGNFHLNASSVARESGTTVAAVTVDFAGMTRPVETFYDIGAYEFSPIAPSGRRRGMTTFGSH